MGFDLKEVTSRNTHFLSFYTLLDFVQVSIQAKSFNTHLA